jgi:hypothetical protein
MRVRGVVKSLLCSFSYRPESLSSYSPYTCTWGGNRRGLGREEEGPAPILILILALSSYSPYTCTWGGNRRGLGKKEEGTSPIPLDSLSLDMV